MFSKLLVINRFLTETQPKTQKINTSLIMTNFDRKYLEMLRKAKSISTQVYERKIGLTKSRYYRWVNNEVDLPMELVMGMKKILGMSNVELLDVMGPETEEGLTFLCSMVYSMFKGLPLNDYLWEIKKHQRVLNSEQPYDIIIEVYYMLQSLLTEAKLNNNLLIKLKKISDLDSYTLIDVIVIAIVMDVENGESIRDGRINTALLEKWIEANITNDSFSFRKVCFGSAIDLALRYFERNELEKGLSIINRMHQWLNKAKVLDNYSAYLLDNLILIFTNSPGAKNNFLESINKGHAFIPELEFQFWSEYFC